MDRKLCARYGGLAGLLIAELLLLTIRFDAAVLYGKTAAWARFLAWSPSLLQLGTAIVGATLLLGGVSLWTELRCEAASGRPGYAWWSFAAGHLAVFAAFVGLTAELFHPDLDGAGLSMILRLSLWCALGVLALALWMLSCLPWTAWRRLAQRRYGMLLLGSSVGLVAWGAGMAASRLWEPLAQATFFVTRELLSFVFPGAVHSDPATKVIGTETFSVEIAPQCSGYEGMGLIAVVLSAYLWFCRRRLRFPASLMLVPLGVGLVWLLNAVRIAALIAIGSWGWPEIAAGGFHSVAGSLAFLAVALGLITVSERIGWLATQRAEAQPSHASGTGAYLAPLMAILLTGMLATTFSAGFEWLYPVRVVVAAGVLWSYRHDYGELADGWSWGAVVVGVMVFAVWIALAPNVAATGWPSALTEAPVGWSAIWLVFRIIGHVMTVPVAEELAFRGYLLRRLTHADFMSVPPGDFTILSLVIASVLFGLLHGSAWLAGMLAGLMFGWAVRRSGQLLDAVVAHVTANLLLAGYILATGRWSLWV